MGFGNLPREAKQDKRTRRFMQNLAGGNTGLFYSDVFQLDGGQLNFAPQAANVGLFGPATGSATAVPTFRALVTADLPTLPAATALALGGVLLATAIGDSTASSVTLSAVTNPADAPATADALRDDLVTNAITHLKTRDTELETAIEGLAAKFNTLLANLRASGALAT